MPRRYEEILEDLEAGEISNEEAAQELKRFSTSSLRQEVAKLPEVEQRAFITAVVRRELGVMATSAAIVAVLAARAQGWI